MRNKTVFFLLSCFVMLSMLASCSTKTTQTSTVTTALTTKPTTITTTVPTIKPTTSTQSASAAQYGGTFTYRILGDYTGFDEYYSSINTQGLHMETLCMPAFTVDHNLWNFDITFVPNKYQTGRLAESWEISPDFVTYTFHIRKGVQWQDKPPVNGRELTAYDVEYSWQRFLGLGSGYTTPSFYAGGQFTLVKSVTATDKYTVVFQLKQPSLAQSYAELSSAFGHIVAREAVEKWGDLQDWRHAIGTGPYIVDDYVSGSSLTYSRNPNYWGYDELFPQNRLPYIDQLKVLQITDDATAYAALRTGKIDLLESVNWEQAKSIAGTNPKLVQVSRPQNSRAVVMLVDKKPFTDIRVRQAMQMALDLQTIAKTYYGGTVDPTPMGLSGLPGYYIPFNEWPQEVKDVHTYNPAGAKKLLSEAGYPNGFKTTLVITASNEPDLCQIIKAYFADIGIDMLIQIMDSPSWSAYTKTENHEMLIDAGTYVTYPPINMLNQYYSKSSRVYSYAHVSDPYYDSLWEKANASISEDEVRKIVIEADTYATAKKWRINLLPYNTYCIYQPWVKRYNGELTLFSDWLGPLSARLWIDQNIKKSTGR
jgi:peptide/nickel transport system substrate-binding protein